MSEKITIEVPEVRMFDVNGTFILPATKGVRDYATSIRGGNKRVSEADLVNAREDAIKTIHRLIRGVENIDALLAGNRPKKNEEG